MRLIVLCLNDCPVGVYSSNALADAAALEDWRRREPRWEELGLQFKQSVNGSIWFYWQHEFTLDKEAHL